jgi:hypothetical protein
MAFLSFQNPSDYTLEATFKPTLTTPPIVPTPGMTPAEMKEVQPQQTPVTKWRHGRGFEDGQTYEIGVKEEVRVKKWVQGSLEGTLEMRKTGEILGLSGDEIRFEIV